MADLHNPGAASPQDQIHCERLGRCQRRKLENCLSRPCRKHDGATLD